MSTTTEMISPNNSVRLKEIDALRGLAAFGVMLLHYTVDFHRDMSPSGISSISWIWGNYGVSLFFLISGFVIFMTAEKSSGPRSFVISRFARLFPVYWFAVIFTASLLILFPMDGNPEAIKLVKRAIVNLTMLQSFVGVGSVDSVYWTLGVELSFYGIFLILIWRNAVDKALLIMTILVGLALIDHVFIPRPLSTIYAYFSNLLILEYVPYFTIGMVFYRARTKFNLNHVMILVLCWVTISSAWYFPHNQSMDIPVTTGIIILFWLASSGRLPQLATPLLTYLGRISYTLYIIHHWVGLIFLKMADNHGMNPNLALLLALVLSLTLAAAISRFVEYPSSNWLKNKLVGTKETQIKPARQS